MEAPKYLLNKSILLLNLLTMPAVADSWITMQITQSSTNDTTMIQQDTESLLQTGNTLIIDNTEYNGTLTQVITASSLEMIQDGANHSIQALNYAGS